MIAPISDADRAVIRRLQVAGFEVTQRGLAWHIGGRGIDILVAQLHTISDADLKPARPNRRNPNE